MARAGAILATVAVVLLALQQCSADSRKHVDPKLTNNLVELIIKKQFDAFVKELGRDDMDANQPDSKGRLPLIEAVKTLNATYVDALIQFNVIANSKDPASGVTPLHLAFQAGAEEIAYMLLKYGADINAADKSGKKARDYAPTQKIRDYIQLYDAKGAMGFEDPPGTWIKSTNDKDETYWYNMKTTEARWNMPPSCAWQRVEIHGQPSQYINYVTGQTVHRVPPALSWRKVRVKGQEAWYNWATNQTQLETPEEMGPVFIEEAEKAINTRWYNEQTQQFTWEDPRFHTPWREVQEEGEDKPYYYNVVTGESTWDVPEELAWTKVEHNEKKGEFYWFNTKTGEASWEAPAHHHEAWTKYNSDL